MYIESKGSGEILKASALARLCECTGSLEPSLFTDVMNTKLSCACPYACLVNLLQQENFTKSEYLIKH